MRHHSEFLMMGIVIFVILLFFQSASAQYAIPRSVFGSGGASLINGSSSTGWGKQTIITKQQEVPS